MSNLNKERLWRSTVLAGFAAVTMGSAPVFAQDAPVETAEEEEAAQQQDTIVVTGSRIRRSTDQPIPLTSIGSEEIEMRGVTNALDILTELPAVQVGSSRRGANNQFGANNAFVDILGLGSNRTLTLVDGRRFVGSNQATLFVPDNISGAQVDLSIINPSLIERVEVVTAAGGAVYGADAVAGVNNVILKRDYEGAEVRVQGGYTGVGDGEEYRISALWGRNFFDGRLNLTLSGEYYDSEIIRGGNERHILAANYGEVNNPLSLSSTDNIPNSIFQINQLNPQITRGGVVGLSGRNSGSTARFFFPNARSQSVSGSAYDAFFAATGASPFQYALNNPNFSGLNPMAFVGTFGLTSGHLTIPNADPATSGFLPRIAVPLRFDSNGNLVPMSLGNITPPTVADQNDVIGGDGYAEPTLANLQSGQERVSFNALWTYEVTPNITYKGDILYTDITNTSQDGTTFNSQTGSSSAGSYALPIYMDQNPYLSAQALGTLNGIEAANGGSLFSTIGGERVFYLARALYDVTGGLNNLSGDTSETIRTAHALEGDFAAFDRDFYWDLSLVYGRNEAKNQGELDIRDVEFALATDVVQDAQGNIVCRQQTLASPEAIDVRNPNLANINIGTTGGLTPTQAQIDACVPLNLFGDGAPSAAAIDYVTGRNDSENTSTQLYLAASLGGDLINLPAGAVSFNTQAEYRAEELEFEVSEFFGTGAGRSTIGQSARGELEFIEVGAELLIPVFSEDFRPIPYGFNALEITGAIRHVERSGEGDDPLNPGSIVESDTTEDVAYTYGFTWNPIDDLQIRATENTSVRSATVVELFGAPQTGFSGVGAFFACNSFFGSGGPATRQANCATFAASEGTTAADFLNLSPANPSVPAAASSNPLLANEEAESRILGFTYTPSWLPNFRISSDYVWFELQGELDLVFPPLQCFDNINFPNSVVNGVAVCDNTVLNIEDPNNPGSFIVPSVNPITGNPVAAVANPGAPSAVQSPYTIAFVQFANGNLGGRRLEALNTSIDYNFSLDNVFNPVGDQLNAIFGGDRFTGLGNNWGDLFVNAEVFYLVESATSASGEFGADTVDLKGEPGSAEWVTRMNLTHRLGRFSHTLQWFHTEDTVDDNTETNLLDQPIDFFNPSTDVFNYNASYQINDRLIGRFVVNDISEATERPVIGAQGIGRRYTVSLTATF